MSRFPACRCLTDILYTKGNFLKLPPQETANARSTILNLVSLNQMTAITANGRYLLNTMDYTKENALLHKKSCPSLQKTRFSAPLSMIC
ncbi:MAG: hypothetical protein DID91_2727703966 [Candidatus Nitrotoga sp. MKT]|nr:MAG: hypothetical protein DID91_2727703966 [Candidatus Nitrotoga sp. MKT]